MPLNMLVLRNGAWDTSNCETVAKTENSYSAKSTLLSNAEVIYAHYQFASYQKRPIAIAN